MKVIVSRSCGFVGSTLINTLLETDPALQIVGSDNFIRPGSYLNREPLQRRGNQLFYADLRNPCDLELLPAADWIIDAAANPSALAGVDAPWCCVLRQIFVGLPARSLFAVPSSTAQRYFSGRFASEEELLHEW